MASGDERAPAISVVVATRNRAETLSRALASVARQTAISFECIVADDGSDAAQFARVAAIVRDAGPRFRLVPASTDGPAPATSPSKARNRALNVARGAFVAFLDDDDMWIADDHLAASVAALDAPAPGSAGKPCADMSFADMRGDGPEGVRIPEWFPGCDGLRRGTPVTGHAGFRNVSLRDFARTMTRRYAHHNTLVVRRSLVERIGGFWEKTQHMEDVNFVLRLADVANGILFREKIVASFSVAQGPSNYRSTPPTEHALVRTLSMSHVLAVAKRKEVRDCAAANLSWNERQLAAAMKAEGNHAAARRFALRAFCTHPSMGSLKELLCCVCG